MFFANTREASFATHPGLFAHFSQFGQCFFGMRQLLLCKADLAESRSATNVHSRTAGWPFMGLVLLPHSPVWMSHTTGQLVEAEEAPLAVAGDPVKLPNMRWPIAHFAFRLRMFPVTTDASIHQRQSQIHLEPISALVFVNVPSPLVLMITALSNVAHNHVHRVNNAVKTPAEDPKAEAIGLQ